MWLKTIKHAFSMFYTLIKHGFFHQSERTLGPIYIINSTTTWYVLVICSQFHQLIKVENLNSQARIYSHLIVTFSCQIISKNSYYHMKT